MEYWKLPLKLTDDALARQQLLGSESRKRIIHPKRDRALIEWARRKMGSQYKDYLDVALKDFYTVSTICMTVNPTLDSVAIAHTVPFHIPDRLPRGWASTPRTERQGFLHPQVMLATYRSVLEIATMIKKKRWRNPTAATLTLMERLPGISRQRAAKYYSMKASSIALDYTAWKYGLRVGGEAVKRYLRLARNPQKLMDAALTEVEHRWGGFSEELRCLLSGQPFDDATHRELAKMSGPEDAAKIGNTKHGSP